MNRTLVIAGLASAVVGTVHLFAGGAAVHDVMLAADFDALAMATMTACWHAVTLIFALFAIAGLSGGWLARPAANTVAMIGPVLFFAFGALFWWLTMTRFGNAFALEQWLLLVPLGLLFGAGYRRDQAVVAATS